jgi:hypothetical protein
MAISPAAPTPTAARPSSFPIEGLRSVAGLVALLAAVAFGLRVLDELPGMTAGVARGVRRVDSVAALERQTSLPVPIPAYFPDTLVWPPADLLVFGDTSTSIGFRHRQSADTWLIVATGVGTTSIAAQLLPPATPLQTEATTVSGTPATVERLRDLDGVIWYQLRWQAFGATRLVRYRGTLDEILLIANSMDRRRQ